MRPIIQSRKHYVQESLQTVLAGNISIMNIAVAADIPGTSNVEIHTGSVVKAVYVEMWARSGDTSGGSVLISLFKGVDGQSMTFVDQTNLNDYNNKKNVLYHTQGNTNESKADATPFVRGWFKIPKGKQRMGLGDTLRLAISAQALDVIVCGFFTYKEYS